MAKEDCFVSVVSPIFNDADILDGFLSEVSGILKNNYANFEIVLVDDGSCDTTPTIISQLLKRYVCVRYVGLSRRFGDEIAIAAGLETVLGDYVVVMLPNIDPPPAIINMIEMAKINNSMVLGIRNSREGESFFVKLGSRVFYQYMHKVLKIDVPKNATHFRVMTRQTVNAITQIRDRLRYLRIFTAYVGYTYCSYNYDPINRRNKSNKREFMKELRLAVNVIVSNTTQPLRFISLLGLSVGVLNLFYMVYVLFTYIYSDRVVEGWVTLSLQSSAMFLFVLVIITVLSEYIGRILNEIHDRPLYYIKEEKNSNVLIPDQDRRNVFTESTTNYVQ